jgi:hypothetical protein
MLGIPTTVITRQGLSQVVGNVFATSGFAPEDPSVYEFPLEMFLPGSDLTPINENIDKIVYGLTKWEPKFKGTGVFYSGAKVTVQGKDYQTAVDNMNALFLKNNWGDGLPIVPPTEERVNWLLTGTDLSRDALVGTGKILPRAGAATVESLAVNLAMAGGRPEYMPVLIAIVEALTDPKLGQESFNIDTNNTFPVVVVNGPIADQIRLGSGYGCMGPDAAHPAGGSIGRALRLILVNLGGAVPTGATPGERGTLAVYGDMRYTNLVFAEDEAGLPPGWDPLSVQEGYPKGDNVVSLQVVSGAVNIIGVTTNGKDLAQQTLAKFGAFMAVPSINYFLGGYADGSPGIMVMGRLTAAGIQSSLGWSKNDVKNYVWQYAKVPWSVLVNTGMTMFAKTAGTPEGQDVPITKKPENITVVVAGGAGSQHGLWLGPTYGIPGTVTTAEAKMPKNWATLLKQAETDLGPLPAPMQ